LTLPLILILILRLAGAACCHALKRRGWVRALKGRGFSRAVTG